MAGLEVLYHPHFEPDLATLRSTLLICDTVHSIIPIGSDFTPSMSTRRHMDSLPDTFIPTAPENDDVKITKDYFVLDALNRSFSQISERKQRNGIQGRFIPQAKAAKETLEINGAVLLHNYKVAYAVYHMLREHNLKYTKTEEMAISW